jgi:hypothetical protein
MENDSALGRMFRNISDKIQDQVWYQQGKAKWDELDARAKTAIRYAMLIGSAALIVGGVGSSLYSVAAQKHEIEEKLGLIQKIKSAQDELRRLRDVTSRFNGGGDQPWGQFLQDQAGTVGIAPDSVKIVSEGVVASDAGTSVPSPKSANRKPKEKGKEKAAAPAAGPEETVVEANLKQINVRQLTKYLHAIENGGRTVKVRRLQIDTHPDGSGYLDATVVVSAFRLNQ